jgi:hypothetical protein
MSAANSEKLVKKAIKTIADSAELEYEQLKSICKKVLKVARTQDEELLGTMESLLDLTSVSSEEELADFDIEVLKIYCRIKNIESSGSERSIRKSVWEHFEEEMEDFDESDEEEDEESEEDEPEPPPVIIKKKKSKDPVIGDSIAE